MAVMFDTRHDPWEVHWNDMGLNMIHLHILAATDPNLNPPHSDLNQNNFKWRFKTGLQEK